MPCHFSLHKKAPVLLFNAHACVNITYIIFYAGIRLIGNKGVTDIQMANALSHLNNDIHIYTNSWGPRDDGMTVAGPGRVLQLALQKDAASVSWKSGTLLT